jgi:hypothetical protein
MDTSFVFDDYLIKKILSKLKKSTLNENLKFIEDFDLTNLFYSNEFLKICINHKLYDLIKYLINSDKFDQILLNSNKKILYKSYNSDNNIDPYIFEYDKYKYDCSLNLYINSYYDKSSNIDDLNNSVDEIIQKKILSEYKELFDFCLLMNDTKILKLFLNCNYTKFISSIDLSFNFLDNFKFNNIKLILESKNISSDIKTFIYEKYIYVNNNANNLIKCFHYKLENYNGMLITSAIRVNSIKLFDLSYKNNPEFKKLTLSQIIIFDNLNLFKHFYTLYNNNLQKDYEKCIKLSMETPEYSNYKILRYLLYDIKFKLSNKFINDNLYNIYLEKNRIFNLLLLNSPKINNKSKKYYDAIFYLLTKTSSTFDFRDYITELNFKFDLNLISNLALFEQEHETIFKNKNFINTSEIKKYMIDKYSKMLNHDVLFTNYCKFFNIKIKCIDIQSYFHSDLLLNDCISDLNVNQYYIYKSCFNNKRAILLLFNYPKFKLNSKIIHDFTNDILPHIQNSNNSVDVDLIKAFRKLKIANIV